MLHAPPECPLVRSFPRSFIPLILAPPARDHRIDDSRSSIDGRGATNSTSRPPLTRMLPRLQISCSNYSNTRITKLHLWLTLRLELRLMRCCCCCTSPYLLNLWTLAIPVSIVSSWLYNGISISPVLYLPTSMILPMLRGNMIIPPRPDQPYMQKYEFFGEKVGSTR